MCCCIGHRRKENRTGGSWESRTACSGLRKFAEHIAALTHGIPGQPHPFLKSGSERVIRNPSGASVKTRKSPTRTLRRARTSSGKATPRESPMAISSSLTTTNPTAPNHNKLGAAPSLPCSLYQKKKRPPSKRGPSCLGSLALRELVGGLTAGWPLAFAQSLGGGWPRYYGCAVPAAAGALWGDAPARAAKLFSISTRCTLLFLTRSGFWSGLLLSAFMAIWLPRATACMR
jgi:hypothetical protein